MTVSVHGGAHSSPRQVASFQVQISPGKANATLTELVGVRDVNWTAGMAFGPFSVVAHDRWGNVASLDCGSFTVPIPGRILRAAWLHSALWEAQGVYNLSALCEDILLKPLPCWGLNMLDIHHLRLQRPSGVGFLSAACSQWHVDSSTVWAWLITGHAGLRLRQPRMHSP